MSQSFFLCPVCKSTESYEDDEGGIVCRSCGTQSQDYLPESFDADDGMETTKVGGRLRTFHEKDIHAKEKRKKKREAAVVPETLDFCMAYQYCLQLMCERVTLAASTQVGASMPLSTLSSLNSHSNNHDNRSGSSSSSSSSSSGISSCGSSQTRSLSDPPTLSSTVKQLWCNYLQGNSETHLLPIV